jgi:predicted TIM-barrel fold metal-dependent hydrolase
MPSRREFQKGLFGLMTVSMLPHRALARPPTGAVAAVDSHAHVFKRGLPLADARRYAPDYDATPEDYGKVLDANGISHAVLVQPSFLGTDNSYLVDALRRYSRFRGIAVVEPTISADALRALDEAGVVGVRLNLIGAPDPQVNADPWPTHLKQLAALGWQVEVQAEARRWPALLGPLLDSGVNVVADHFGKPDPALGVDDPGFRYLLTAGQSRRLWVKLSGAYRNGDGNIGERIARAAIPLFRDNLGIDRLVWGSDWPHTQFESVADYAAIRASLDTWLPDPQERRTVLVNAPVGLFKFDKVEQPSREPASMRQ